MDNRVIAIDNRVIELAEKIYAEVVGEIVHQGNFEGNCEIVAENSITAAQVFYGVKKKMMMNVKEGDK